MRRPQVCKEEGFAGRLLDFRNFHDSSRFGGVDRGWYDADHMDPVNMTKVVLALAGGGAEPWSQFQHIRVCLRAGRLRVVLLQ
jgi:hypothetical protein